MSTLKILHEEPYVTCTRCGHVYMGRWKIIDMETSEEKIVIDPCPVCGYRGNE